MMTPGRPSQAGSRRLLDPLSQAGRPGCAVQMPCQKPNIRDIKLLTRHEGADRAARSAFCARYPAKFSDLGRDRK